MTDTSAQNDPQAIRAWYKKTLDDVVGEMLKKEVLAGVAIEANPVWAVNYQILIAKIWNANEKSRFIWTISGEKVITDYVAGSVASSPQEVARHFALKWQLDAERLTGIARERSKIEGSQERMEGYTQKLIENAELLYDLAGRDEIWKPKLH